MKVAEEQEFRKWRGGGGSKRDEAYTKRFQEGTDFVLGVVQRTATCTR